jgi:hypothetical protein
MSKGESISSVFKHHVEVLQVDEGQWSALCSGRFTAG